MIFVDYNFVLDKELILSIMDFSSQKLGITLRFGSFVPRSDLYFRPRFEGDKGNLIFYSRKDVEILLSEDRINEIVNRNGSRRPLESGIKGNNRWFFREFKEDVGFFDILYPKDTRYRGNTNGPEIVIDMMATNKHKEFHDYFLNINKVIRGNKLKSILTD